MKNSNTTSVIWEYPISHTRGPKETCRIEKTKLNRVDTENFLASFKQAYIVLLCVLILFSLSFVFIATSRAGSLERPLTTRLPSMENNITDLMNSFMLETIESPSEELGKSVPIVPIKYIRYTVQKNETIESIAKRFKLTIDTIALSNGILRQTQLKIGQKLLIPNQNGRIIEVKRNESIQQIAAKFHVSWKDIVDVNELESQNIKPNAVLFIPDSQFTMSEKKSFYFVAPKVVKRKQNSTEKMFEWPKKGVITSYFGVRTDPIKFTKIFHSGIDIRGTTGDAVYAAADGVVAYTGWTSIYGNFILIKHSNEFVTLYGHLSSIDVQKDDKVTTEKIIGKVGSTGRSTGPHLHFEVRKNNVPVNPIPYL